MAKELPDRDTIIASLWFTLCQRDKHCKLEKDDNGDVTFVMHKASIEGNRGYDAVLTETDDGHVRVTLKR